MTPQQASIAFSKGLPFMDPLRSRHTPKARGLRLRVSTVGALMVKARLDTGTLTGEDFLVIERCFYHMFYLSFRYWFVLVEMGCGFITGHGVSCLLRFWGRKPTCVFLTRRPFRSAIHVLCSRDPVFYFRANSCPGAWMTDRSFWHISIVCL